MYDNLDILMEEEKEENLSNLLPDPNNDKKKIFYGHRVESDWAIPFEEVTAQVLAEEVGGGRGFTSYDLISRTLHQLSRDGNHQLLALALDRLGEQCQRRINQLDTEKLAPLHYASRYSHPYTVLTLLQRKAKINIRGQDNLTPLHCAARYRKSIRSSSSSSRHRYVRVARRRMSKGAPNAVQRRSGWGEEEEGEEERKGEEEEEQGEEEKEETKEGGGEEDHKKYEDGKDIECATSKLSEDDDANEGDHDAEEDEDDDDNEGASVVKVLVENGADVDARDVYGLTPLHYAAMRGHDVAARDLLTYGHVNLEARDKQQMTPLFIAATFGYIDICRRLIDCGAQIIALDESHQTPLHRAAAEGHLDIVKMLLATAFKEAGKVKMEKFISLRDIERQTALHLAVVNGNTETAQWLLSKGADVNVVRNTLATPLHAAAIVGDIELIRMLIQEGANIEAVDTNQQTPLHKAAANNRGDAISLLIKHNASIEKRDKDSFTALLLAACSGLDKAVAVLLSHGARSDVIDKEDRTAVFWCAKEGHVDAMQLILSTPSAAKIVDFSDRLDNSPLHEAARNGHLEVVRLLLSNGSKIDNKNEDEETALHVAAEMGKLEVVQELLLTFRFLINDENEDGNTPLHLASMSGHTDVVEVLLKSSADVEARNTLLWTPLDCSSANGHVDVCRLLIDNDSPLDPLDKTKTTPLQLASQRGHVEVIELLLEKGASVAVVDSSGKNALEIAATHGRSEAAMAIVRSSQWLESLKNERTEATSGRRVTPFRLLVQRLPLVAKVVLDRCMTTNGKESDHKDYGIMFNFELIDDTYVVVDDERERDGGGGGGGVRAAADDDDAASLLGASTAFESAYDDDGKLLELAVPYTRSTRLLKLNHPLMLMAEYKRCYLLGHPVSVSLLKHKWQSYARLVYYFNLIFYIIFLSFLTGYVCNSLDWKQASALLAKKGVVKAPSEVTCADVADLLSLPESPVFISVGYWVLIVMTVFNMLRELFQIYQARLNYLGGENFLEWVCYIGALLLVVDWTPESPCYVREEVQWQLGALVIFVAWLNLVLFFRKLPLFGIYVVMFTDVFTTFTRFFVVFFLFVIGFALSFSMLFRTQVPFEYVGKSLLKTSVMMVGEFEFDAIFNGGPEAPLQYPEVSYLLFAFFLVLMSILIMNLLVGLAVDDIKAVQDQAVLKRRAMQTKLILDVEELIPESVRRYFARPFKKFFPNKKRSALRKVCSDFSLLHSFDYTQFNDANKDCEDLSNVLKKLHDQIAELRNQNQKMYSLFTTSFALNRKHTNRYSLAKKGQ